MSKTGVTPILMSHARKGQVHHEQNRSNSPPSRPRTKEVNTMSETGAAAVPASRARKGEHVMSETSANTRPGYSLA